MDEHPDSTLLSAFGRGRLSRRRSRQVVRHLLNGCATCRQAAAELLPCYGEAFARSWQEVERHEAALTLEREAAPELLQALLAQAPERRLERVAQDPRLRTWALCERLLEVSRDWGFQDSACALELSQLGIGVASRLDPAVYGQSRVNDLVARAWVVLGSAQQLGSSFQEAEKSFTQAEGFLRRGTGDPLEKAHFLLHRASLLGNQQRLAEAFRLLDRVIAIARRTKDPELHSRALTAALLSFQKAAEMECVIRGLIRGVSSYLKENGEAVGLRSRESR